jgi:hypothetical protein
MGQVLGIVYHVMATHLLKKAGVDVARTVWW